MARLLWPGENAIGKCFAAGDEKTCAEVIGVVPDARRFQAVEDASMTFYVPFSGNSDQYITALVVRPRGRPEDWIATIRSAVQATAPNLPFASVTPLADLLAPSIRPWRLGSAMFAGFALLALVLSAVGLYGVLNYVVRSEEHTSELQSHHDLVCRLLLEKKNNNIEEVLSHGAVREFLLERRVAD